MPVRSKEDLLLQLDAVASSNDNANALCRLAGLAIQGNAGAKRGRLAALASGPDSRQRLGWLDLVLRAFAAGARSVDDLDSRTLEPAQLADGSCDLLLDLLDRVPTGGLMRFLPASILSDLQRTEVDEDNGSVEFALDGSLPSVAAIVAFAGAEVDAAAPAGDAADLQLRVDELSEALASQESRLRERIIAEVRDGKLALPAEQSVSAQRESFAFPLDPERFVLLGTERDANGVRIPLCAPKELLDDPIHLSDDMFHDVMFESKVKPPEVKAIQRRNLMPSSVFCDASVLSAEHVGAMGGSQCAEYKKYDALRVKQQSALHPVQAQFRALGHGSEVLLDLLELSDFFQPGDDDDASPVPVLPDDQKQLLDHALGAAEQLVSALSDAVLLASVDLSELERQKQECYVRGRSGNSRWQMDRDSGKKLQLNFEFSSQNV